MELLMELLLPPRLHIHHITYSTDYTFVRYSIHTDIIELYAESIHTGEIRLYAESIHTGEIRLYHKNLTPEHPILEILCEKHNLSIPLPVLEIPPGFTIQQLSPTKPLSDKKPLPPSEPMDLPILHKHQIPRKIFIPEDCHGSGSPPDIPFICFYIIFLFYLIRTFL